MKRRFILPVGFYALGSLGHALPPPTNWLGGTGSFYTASKWSAGVPGELKVGPDFFNMTSSPTGSWVNFESFTINTGSVTMTPAIATIYKLAADEEDRYSLQYFVSQLDLPNMILGQTGSGSLTLSGGMNIYASTAILGNASGSAGTLNVSETPIDGGNYSFQTGDSTVVGKNGIGQMTISNGAKAYFPEAYKNYGPDDWNIRYTHIGSEVGSNGSVKITGAGSSFNYVNFTNLNASGLVIGRKGVGSFSVENGASSLTTAGRLGYGAGSQGFATVTGAGSRWDVNAQLYIGESGSGSMLVGAGGLVRSGFGTFQLGTVENIDQPNFIALDFGSIGTYAGSQGSVTVNGANSRWENNANLVIGLGGTGSMTIEGGGTVVSATRTALPSNAYWENTTSIIGEFTGSTGTVRVSGANSHWQNGAGLVIGDAGTGALSIGTGGTIDVTGDPTIHLGNTGAGTLTFGGDASAGVGSLGGSVIEGGTGTTVVDFKHNSAGFTLNHVLKNIKTIKNTGPGKTTIAGQIQTATTIRAEAGTLELSDTQHPIDAKTISITGGNLVLNGASLTLPAPLVSNGTLSQGGISLINGGKLSSVINLSGNSGTASFVVDGSGSIFTPKKTTLLPSLIIGDNGVGNLTAQNFGKIAIDPATGPPVVLGNNTGGIGTLSILSIGSEMTTGSMTVGRLGVGNIVLNYGPLSSTSAVLGSQAGSTGSVTVSNLGSWRIDANALSVGSSGTGRVTLNSSGSLRIGATGTGTLTLGETETGKGTLEIGTGGTPGILYAGRVTTGDTELGAQVLFRHTASSYNFAPSINYTEIRVLDGNLGTTTLTGQNTSIPNIIVTSGGLRVAAGGSTVISNEAIIGDERPQDMNGGALAFLEIDGTGSILAADRDIVVGSKANAELRLKNGGIAQSGRPEELHEIILGDQHGIGTVIFGGAGANPGNVSASAIRSVEAGGKVIFDHPAANLTVSTGFSGNLAVDQRGSGTTLLTGSLSNTGATAITAGTLLYSSSSNSSQITVSGTGTVGGTGILPKLSLQSGGTISPGTNGIASQRVGIFNVAAGAKFRIDLGPNLTCDQILNNSTLGVYLDMAFNPPATGNVTFEFRNSGITQNGVYPIFIPYTQLTADFLSRLNFTANFPLQGHFQQTYVNNGTFDRHYQLEFVVTSSGVSDYNTWATGYSLDPAANGLPTADPDKDGLNNMLEFMIGSSPISGLTSRLPVMTASGGNATFTFLRRQSSETLFTTTVQSSTDLGVWTDAAAGTLISTPSAVDHYDTVTATLPIPPGSPKFFTRLKVVPVSP